MCVLSCFSRVELFAALWTATRQAPLSLELYLSKNTRVGCPSLLQGVSPPRDQTRAPYVSCTGKQVLCHSRHLGSIFQTVSCSSYIHPVRRYCQHPFYRWGIEAQRG